MDQLNNFERVNPINLKQIQGALDAIRHLGLVKLSEWMGKVGISSTTVWRWRKRGWLKTVNIGGLEYLTYEDLANFMVKAKSGDFAVASTKKLKNLNPGFKKPMALLET